MTKSTKGHHSKVVWKVPNLEKRVIALIHEGALLKKGDKTIVATIAQEFSDELASAKLKFTLTKLNARLHEFVWTKKVTGELWNAHSNRMIDVFRTHHSYIPEAMVERELRKLKGVTVATSITETKAGMGRLTADAMPLDAGKFEFKPNSYHEPLVISTKPEGCVSIINGALIGIKFTDISSSAPRRALADARKRGAAAVILTNLIDLWTKKTAGFLAVYRAMVSGIQINPDRFPTDYQQEVRDILDGTITDETIYQTLNERFEEILDGLDKITHRPGNKGPEAGTVPVLLQLCYKEEELINAAAYYELRYLTIVKQNKIEAELNMAASRFAEAKADGDIVEMQKWSGEVARLSRLKSRAIITNHTGPEYERYRRRFRAYVVKRLESVIPNCTVVSQGSAYYKVGDQWIIKTSIPSDDKVTDAHLQNAGSTYGYDVFRDVLADLTVVCPPCSLNFRDVGREDSKDYAPVTKFMAVAPSCLDAEFLREQFRDVTKLSHSVQELVCNPQFKPGVLLITWNNSILSYDALPIERLDRNDELTGTTNYAFPFPKTKYLTWFVNTDNHFGAPDKRFIWDPKDRIHRGVTEAAIELMRREGIVKSSSIPIHFTAEMDDATNGDMWFNPRYRPDPNRLMLVKFERWMRQISGDIQLASERGDGDAVKELVDELNRISIAQLNFRGEDFPFHQMQAVFQRHIAPNIDFYSAVLMRFAKSGINLTPISKLGANARVHLCDDRDLGVHNFPNGNHRIKTLDQKDQEGPYIAGHTREMLKQRTEWRQYFKGEKFTPQQVDDYLEATVRAPLFGNETYGWGLVQAPGGYRWGVRVHATPARLSSWHDLLAAVIKSDLARGDDSYGLLKQVTVTFYGDKHFYGRAETERMNYIMCAAGVHTNLYGSSGGFPPNNTGVCFVSLPAGGPAEGPIIIRRLPHDFLRDWFTKPTPFNFSTFLPEPV
jgi:hypothetical protein